MNKLKVKFTQDIKCKDQTDRYTLIIENETEDTFDKNYLKMWATFVLYNHLKLYSALDLNKATFNLKKVILAEVFFNEESISQFVQIKLNKTRIIRKGFDYPFLIKKSKYLLIPLSEYKKQKEATQDDIKIENINLNKILNTIEYQTMEKIKYATPLLYTGMTN
jgi:hypothetical protein